MPMASPRIVRRDIHGCSEEVQQIQVRDQRVQRQRDIDDAGWASDIHKPYKPLGAPDLEREMPAPQLISKTPRALARKQQARGKNRAGGNEGGPGSSGADGSAAGRKEGEDSEPRIIIPISHRPVQQDNGWSLLQSAINKSSQRMVGCKFGSSFPELMLRQGFQMHSQSPLKMSVSQVDLKGEISKLSVANPPGTAASTRMNFGGTSSRQERRTSGNSEDPTASQDADNPAAPLQRDPSNLVVYADEQQLKSIASTIKFPPIGLGLPAGQAGAKGGSHARSRSPRGNKGGLANNPYMTRLYEALGEDPGENALASVVQSLLPNPAQLRIECDPERAVQSLLDDFKQCKESLKEELSASLQEMGAMMGENYVYRSLALRTEGPSTNTFSARRWELEAERSRVLERLQAIDAHPWYNRLMFLLTQSHHGLTLEQEAIMSVVKDVVERGEEFTDEELFGLMLLVPRSYHSLDAVQKIFIFIRDEVQVPQDLWMAFVTSHNLTQFVNLAKRDMSRTGTGRAKGSRGTKRNQLSASSMNNLDHGDVRDTSGMGLSVREEHSHSTDSGMEGSESRTPVTTVKLRPAIANQDSFMRKTGAAVRFE